MRHNVHREGFGIRLRPVRIDDAAFIVWVRNLKRSKGKVGDSATDVKAQEAWLAAYFERAGDFYFIVETIGGIPAGTIGIYDVAGPSGEQGRLVMRSEVLAGLPAMLLGYDLCYSEVKLTEVRGTVVASNTPMHSFLRQFGFRKIKIEVDAQIIGGNLVDIVHYRQNADDWAKARLSLLPVARTAEAKLLDWQSRELSNPRPPPWQPNP